PQFSWVHRRQRMCESETRSLAASTTYALVALGICPVYMTHMPDATRPRNVHRALVPIPSDMLPRIDEHVERIKKRAKTPHLQVPRTDAIVDLLTRGLAEAERER